MVIICKSVKSKYDSPYVDELTVFIKVNIDSLKEVSNSIPEIDNNIVKIKSDIMNISTVKKYLLTSLLLILMSEK